MHHKYSSTLVFVGALATIILTTALAWADRGITTYSSPDSSSFRFESIKQADDGTYVLAGSIEVASGNRDIFVVKLASDFSVAWTLAYGGTGNDVAHDVQPTSDGGYVVAGKTFSVATGGVLISKITGAGTLQWHTFLEEPLAFANSIIETADGEFIISGFREPYYARLWKLDGAGTLLAMKSLVFVDPVTGVTNLMNRGLGMAPTADGGFIEVGHTGVNKDTPGAQDLFVAKFDAALNGEWHKVFAGADSDDDSANSITQTRDGGFVLTGYTTRRHQTPLPEHDPDLLVMRLNRRGEIMWQKSWGGVSGKEEFGTTVMQLRNPRGFLVAGRTSGLGPDGPYDAVFLRLRATGKLVGSAKILRIGQNTADWPWMGTSTSGGFLVVGTSGFSSVPPPDKEPFDPFLVKLDATGSLEGWACPLVLDNATALQDANLSETGLLRSVTDTSPLSVSQVSFSPRSPTLIPTNVCVGP